MKSMLHRPFNHNTNLDEVSCYYILPIHKSVRQYLLKDFLVYWLGYDAKTMESR